ncbi:hypothetical protein GCM10009566_57480 [Streptomyces murinus]
MPNHGGSEEGPRGSVGFPMRRCRTAYSPMTDALFADEFRAADRSTPEEHALRSNP